MFLCLVVMKTTCFILFSDSEFIFDPVKWPRNQVDEDFQTIAQTYGALNSVVRVPSIDPKYKIALLLSKQVLYLSNFLFSHLLFEFPTQKYVILYIQDHCLVEMLHRWQDGKLPVDITCVIRSAYSPVFIRMNPYII